MALITLTFGFFEGDEREPPLEEVKSLVCYTQDYFSSELQKVLGDAQVSVKAKEVGWTYDEDGTKKFKLMFASDVTDGSGALIPENDVFQALKFAENDLQSYVADFVGKVKPAEGETESVFLNVEEIDFESSQNVEIPAGELPNGISEPCSQYQDEDQGSEDQDNESPATGRGTQLGMSV